MSARRASKPRAVFPPKLADIEKVLGPARKWGWGAASRSPPRWSIVASWKAQRF